MSIALRSKQGCWTCRLRKKKCDENRPFCSACESLSIECYGFGPKPDWMGNGEEEKAVAQSIKERVRAGARRKPTSSYRDPVIKLAPKPSLQSSGNLMIDHGSSSQDIYPLVDLTLNETGMADSPQNIPGQTEVSNTATTKPKFLITPDESFLLMHFLENVFPLQYPMYKPVILEGGRGWLLGLVLRTEPLYYATLAISAYHHRIVTLSNIDHSHHHISMLVRQEKYLEVCIKSTAQMSENSCSRLGQGILAAVVQLIFVELFTSPENKWQSHLHAAVSMYIRSFENDFASYNFAAESRTVLRDDLPLGPSAEPKVSEEVVSMRFLSAILIWLDTISSITSGKAPRLHPLHRRMITGSSQTKLEKVVGCKNWVILQVGRIAILHEHKMQTLKEGEFNCREFEQSVDDIRNQIQYGLARDLLGDFNCLDEGDQLSLNALLDPITLISQSFGYMAIVYLHLITYGFHKLDLVDTVISKAVEMFRTQISAHLLPALVAPLFIIGCVSKSEEEHYFRDCFSAPPLSDPSRKHRSNILPVLEEVWSTRRRATPIFLWAECIEITNDVLLI